MSVWTHDLLDRLRQIGDPELDERKGHKGWRDVPVHYPTDEKGNDARVERPGTNKGDVELLEAWRAAEDGALPVREAVRLGEEWNDGKYKDGSLAERYWITAATPTNPLQIRLARDLFIQYGGEIAATLVLASLPNAYAAEVGAGVMATTHELRSNTRRRIAETSQFVVEVLFPFEKLVFTDPHELWDIAQPDQGAGLGSRAYIRVRTTRLTHAVIRGLISRSEEERDGKAVKRWDPQATGNIPRFPDVKRGVPINQEDLLGTLCTFTVTTFEVMERFGVPWTSEAEQAYLALWDQVGELLGIGTPEVTDLLEKDGVALPPEYVGSLRPKTPDDARALAELIRVRNWPLPQDGRVLGPFAGANGKVLVRALLDELQEAMPRGMERLPLTVMRYLVDPRAHELLGLGGGGLGDSLLRLPGALAARSRHGGGFWTGKSAVEASMRVAANDISRRAFIHFIRAREGDSTQRRFWFPGLTPDHVEIPIAGRRANPSQTETKTADGRDQAGEGGSDPSQSS